MRSETLEVRRVIALRFPAARALHVEDGNNPFRNTRRAAVAACLEQHGPAAIQQPLHQRIHVVLQQWLASGDLDEGAPKLIDLVKNRLDGPFLPFVKRVWGIAPGTAEVASGQPDEDTRPSGIGGLTLDGVEDLVDREHVRG